MLPELFTRDDEAMFEVLADVPVLDQLASAVGPGVSAVMDAARLAVAMRRSRLEHLNRLRDEVDLPTLYLPYLFARSQGRRETAMVAHALAGEMGL